MPFSGQALGVVQVAELPVDKRTIRMILPEKQKLAAKDQTEEEWHHTRTFRVIFAYKSLPAALPEVLSQCRGF